LVGGWYVGVATGTSVVVVAVVVVVVVAVVAVVTLLFLLIVACLSSFVLRPSFLQGAN
jgi:hypothetical protein